MKIIDAINKRFGDYTVISIAPVKNHHRFFLTKCEGGHERIIRADKLRHNIKCPKCNGTKLLAESHIDLIGKRFKTFTVICKDKVINRHWHYLLRCNCGYEKTRTGADLQRKNATVKKCPMCCNNIRKPISVICEMLRNSKKRSKKMGWEFNLTLNFIEELNKKQKGKCAYSGIEMNWNCADKGDIKGFALATRASIDRIDSSKGYTKDNVQLVIDSVNRMKCRMSHNEFISICKLIVDKSLV